MLLPLSRETESSPGAETLSAPQGLEYLNSALKRSFDLAALAILLPATFPLRILGQAAVALEDGRPTVIELDRIGQDGKVFKMPKIRSMFRGIEKIEPTLESKCRDDPRVTRAGAILRRTTIDELPQLGSVLRGDMHLVGARARANCDIESYQRIKSEDVSVDMQRLAELACRKDLEEPEDVFQVWYPTVMKTKPAATGYVQINGRADLDCTDEGRLERMCWDLRYMEKASPLEDAKILAQTAGAVLSRNGAY